MVENQIILKLRSIDEVKGIHEAQLLTSMKLAGIRHGFRINFNVALLKEDLRSFVF
ncbi:MAG TPA: GxxExxY protein [Candidatus Paceibacterota bacterium]|nr:GxxExxY protein [Verrucomicrobiota bacterium]HRY52028.1 GxxExxY protein [Candidatus Paceibacterota bacterium]HSA03575.1 GxxExxY protein [Candidatus Paceibacterota bacterium]